MGDLGPFQVLDFFLVIGPELSLLPPEKFLRTPMMSSSMFSQDLVGTWEVFCHRLSRFRHAERERFATPGIGYPVLKQN